MNIYPAVDIKEGKCVRLTRGLADEKKVYFENPVEAAKEFLRAGSKVIHVVDLDGAFGGRMQNLAAIEKIAALGMFVEMGGGMRNISSVRAAFDAGVGRAIIGTKACTNPEFAVELADKFGEKIAVGIDAKGGKVAIKGWVEVGDNDACALASALASKGVKTFIYTDIDTDGTLGGVNLAAQEHMLKTLAGTGAKLIASGGVASKEDVCALKKLSDKYAHLDGAIVGKAIYEKRVSLPEIIKIALG